MRPTVPQQLSTIVVPVAATPIPLSANPALTSAYIDSFIICLYSTAANSVFFGDGTVTATNGIEIIPGSSVQFSISNERPLYELQLPLLPMSSQIVCAPMPQTEIPFVYWDLSQLYLIAAVAGPTSVIIMPFKRAYV